jgi:uncharacterized membrane protein
LIVFNGENYGIIVITNGSNYNGFSNNFYPYRSKRYFSS